MVRSTTKSDELATLKNRREEIEAELKVLTDREKELEIAARDAGRPTMIAALDRIKIAELGKDEAKVIATAIAKHGGKAVADHLSSLTRPDAQSQPIASS